MKNEHSGSFSGMVGFGYTAVSAPDGHNLAINSWSHYLPTCVQDEDGWCHGKKELIAYWVQVPWSHGA